MSWLEDRLRGINVWSSSPLPDINALRSAPHRANCSGRCQGGYGEGRYPLPKHVARRELALASSLARLPSIADSANPGLDRHLFTVRVATAVAFRIMSADRAGSV